MGLRYSLVIQTQKWTNAVLSSSVLRLSPVNAIDQDLGIRERRKCSSNQAMYVPCRRMLEVIHRGTDEKDDKRNIAL